MLILVSVLSIHFFVVVRKDKEKDDSEAEEEENKDDDLVYIDDDDDGSVDDDSAAGNDSADDDDCTDDDDGAADNSDGDNDGNDDGNDDNGGASDFDGDVGSAAIDSNEDELGCDSGSNSREQEHSQRKKRRTDTYTTNEFQKPKYVDFSFTICLSVHRSFVRTFGKSVGLPSKWKQDAAELDRIANQPNAPRLLRVHKALQKRLIDYM